MRSEPAARLTAATRARVKAFRAIAVLLLPALLALTAPLQSVVPGVAAAAVWSSAAGGSWLSGAAWQGGSAPGAADDVTIADGTSVTVDAGTNVTCRTLSIPPGSAGSGLYVDGGLYVTGDVLVLRGTSGLPGLSVTAAGSAVLWVGGSAVVGNRTTGCAGVVSAAIGTTVVIARDLNLTSADSASEFHADGACSIGGALYFGLSGVTSAYPYFALSPNYGTADQLAPLLLQTVSVSDSAVLESTRAVVARTTAITDPRGGGMAFMLSTSGIANVSLGVLSGCRSCALRLQAASSLLAPITLTLAPSGSVLAGSLQLTNVLADVSPGDALQPGTSVLLTGSVLTLHDLHTNWTGGSLQYMSGPYGPPAFVLSSSCAGARVDATVTSPFGQLKRVQIDAGAFVHSTADGIPYIFTGPAVAGSNATVIVPSRDLNSGRSVVYLRGTGTLTFRNAPGLDSSSTLTLNTIVSAGCPGTGVPVLRLAGDTQPGTGPSLTLANTTSPLGLCARIESDAALGAGPDQMPFVRLSSSLVPGSLLVFARVAVSGTHLTGTGAAQFIGCYVTNSDFAYPISLTLVSGGETTTLEAPLSFGLATQSSLAPVFWSAGTLAVVPPRPGSAAAQVGNSSVTFFAAVYVDASASAPTLLLGNTTSAAVRFGGGPYGGVFVPAGARLALNCSIGSADLFPTRAIVVSGGSAPGGSVSGVIPHVHAAGGLSVTGVQWSASVLSGQSVTFNATVLGGCTVTPTLTNLQANVTVDGAVNGTGVDVFFGVTYVFGTLVLSNGAGVAFLSSGSGQLQPIAGASPAAPRVVCTDTCAVGGTLSSAFDFAMVVQVEVRPGFPVVLTPGQRPSPVRLLVTGGGQLLAGSSVQLNGVAAMFAPTSANVLPGVNITGTGALVADQTRVYGGARISTTGGVSVPLGGVAIFDTFYGPLTLPLGVPLQMAASATLNISLGDSGNFVWIGQIVMTDNTNTVIIRNQFARSPLPPVTLGAPDTSVWWTATNAPANVSSIAGTIDANTPGCTVLLTVNAAILTFGSTWIGASAPVPGGPGALWLMPGQVAGISALTFVNSVVIRGASIGLRSGTGNALSYVYLATNPATPTVLYAGSVSTSGSMGGGFLLAAPAGTTFRVFGIIQGLGQVMNLTSGQLDAAGYVSLAGASTIGCVAGASFLSGTVRIAASVALVFSGDACVPAPGATLRYTQLTAQQPSTSSVSAGPLLQWRATANSTLIFDSVNLQPNPSPGPITFAPAFNATIQFVNQQIVSAYLSFVSPTGTGAPVTIVVSGSTQWSVMNGVSVPSGYVWQQVGALNVVGSGGGTGVRVDATCMSPGAVLNVAPGLNSVTIKSGDQSQITADMGCAQLQGRIACSGNSTQPLAVTVAGTVAANGTLVFDSYQPFNPLAPPAVVTLLTSVSGSLALSPQSTVQVGVGALLTGALAISVPTGSLQNVTVRCENGAAMAGVNLLQAAAFAGPTQIAQNAYGCTLSGAMTFGPLRGLSGRLIAADFDTNVRFVGGTNLPDLNAVGVIGPDAEFAGFGSFQLDGAAFPFSGTVASWAVYAARLRLVLSGAVIQPAAPLTVNGALLDQPTLSGTGVLTLYNGARVQYPQAPLTMSVVVPASAPGLPASLLVEFSMSSSLQTLLINALTLESGVYFDSNVVVSSATVQYRNGSSAFPFVRYGVPQTTVSFTTATLHGDPSPLARKLLDCSNGGPCSFGGGTLTVAGPLHFAKAVLVSGTYLYGGVEPLAGLPPSLWLDGGTTLQSAVALDPLLPIRGAPAPLSWYVQLPRVFDGNVTWAGALNTTGPGVLACTGSCTSYGNATLHAPDAAAAVSGVIQVNGTLTLRAAVSATLLLTQPLPTVYADPNRYGVLTSASTVLLWAPGSRLQLQYMLLAPNVAFPMTGAVGGGGAIDAIGDIQLQPPQNIAAPIRAVRGDVRVGAANAGPLNVVLANVTVGTSFVLGGFTDAAVRLVVGACIVAGGTIQGPNFECGPGSVLSAGFAVNVAYVSSTPGCVFRGGGIPAGSTFTMYGLFSFANFTFGAGFAVNGSLFLSTATPTFADITADTGGAVYFGTDTLLIAPAMLPGADLNPLAAVTYHVDATERVRVVGGGGGTFSVPNLVLDGSLVVDPNTRLGVRGALTSSATTRVVALPGAVVRMGDSSKLEGVWNATGAAGAASAFVIGASSTWPAVVGLTTTCTLVSGAFTGEGADSALRVSGSLVLDPRVNGSISGAGQLPSLQLPQVSVMFGGTLVLTTGAQLALPAGGTLTVDSTSLVSLNDSAVVLLPAGQSWSLAGAGTVRFGAGTRVQCDSASAAFAGSFTGALVGPPQGSTMYVSGSAPLVFPRLLLAGTLAVNTTAYFRVDAAQFVAVPGGACVRADGGDVYIGAGSALGNGVRFEAGAPSRPQLAAPAFNVSGAVIPVTDAAGWFVTGLNARVRLNVSLASAPANATVTLTGAVDVLGPPDVPYAFAGARVSVVPNAGNVAATLYTPLQLAALDVSGSLNVSRAGGYPNVAVDQLSVFTGATVWFPTRSAGQFIAFQVKQRGTIRGTLTLSAQTTFECVAAGASGRCVFGPEATLRTNSGADFGTLVLRNATLASGASVWSTIDVQVLADSALGLTDTNDDPWALYRLTISGGAVCTLSQTGVNPPPTINTLQLQGGTLRGHAPADPLLQLPQTVLVVQLAVVYPTASDLNALSAVRVDVSGPWTTQFVGGGFGQRYVMALSQNASVSTSGVMTASGLAPGMTPVPDLLIRSDNASSSERVQFASTAGNLLADDFHVTFAACTWAPYGPHSTSWYAFNTSRATFDEPANCLVSDLYHSCASSPCTAGQTRACVPYENLFVCDCLPGYTGVLCQTDIDECASSPCQNGATCHDMVNAFNCTCTAGWNGTRCEIDINECATNYGGCPLQPQGTCTNTPGSYRCTYLVPGFTVTPTAGGTARVQQPNSATTLVLAGTEPAVFALSLVTAPLGRAYTDLTIAAYIETSGGGTVDAVNPTGSIACSVDEYAVDALQRFHSLHCTLGQWYGAVNRFRVFDAVSGELLAVMNTTFGYPAPTYAPFSLRVLNDTDPNFGTYPDPTLIGAFGGADLPRFDGDDYRILVFDGTGFGPVVTPANAQNVSLTTVWYGVSGAPEANPCNVDPTYCSPTRLACRTKSGVGGALMRLTVIVGGRFGAKSAVGGGRYVQGRDSFTFPTKPVITGVYGCSGQSENATFDCPTRGGINITVTGVNLLAPLSVFVNGVEIPGSRCFPAPDGSSVVALLPSSAGQGVIVSVTAGGEKSAALPLLSYALPRIDRLVGCSVRPSDNTTEVVANCDRNGTSVVTVYGQYFGYPDALIIIGQTIVQTVTYVNAYGNSTDDTALAFRVPQGTGLLQNLLVIQGAASGYVGPSLARLSYAQCQPGQRVVDTYFCADCGNGTYSAVPDAPACSKCPPGFFPATVTGASSCTRCGPGTYSDEGSTSCRDCAIGTEQPGSAQPSCAPCGAGYYSAQERTVSCTPCPAGTAQPATGQSTCKTCQGIRNQLFPGQPACQSCVVGNFFSPFSGSGVANGSCQACPTRAICNDSGIFPAGNFYVYYDLKLNEIVARDCLPGYCDACPSQLDTRNGSKPGTLLDTNPALTPLYDGMTFTCCQGARVDAQDNPMCGQCLPGYYVSGTDCVQCDEPNAGFLVLLLVALWAYMFVFFRLAQIDSADTRIFLNFVQFVLVFLQTQAGGVVGWMNVFNANLFQSGGGQCILPLTPLQDLATGVIVPALGATMLLANCVIHYVVWRCLRAGYCDTVCVTPKYLERRGKEPTRSVNDKSGNKRAGAAVAIAHKGRTPSEVPPDFNPHSRSNSAAPGELFRGVADGEVPPPPPLERQDSGLTAHDGATTCCEGLRDSFVKSRQNTIFAPVWNAYKRALLAYLLSSYPAIVQTAFTFFTCVDARKGSWMQYYPAQSCEADAYRKLTPVFALLLVFSIALPIGLFVRLYQLNASQVLWKDPVTRFVWGAMTDAFPRSAYSWEVWSLVRRFVIAAVALLAYPNDIALKFTWLACCNVLFTALHFTARPYVLVTDNLWEGLGMMTLTILTIFMASAPIPLPQPLVIGLTCMCFLVAAVLAARIGLSRYETFKAESVHLKAVHRKRLEVRQKRRQLQQQTPRGSAVDLRAADAAGAAATDAPAFGAAIAAPRESLVGEGELTVRASAVAAAMPGSEPGPRSALELATPRDSFAAGSADV